MKSIIWNSIAVFIFLFFSTLSLSAQTAQDIMGKWQDEENTEKQIEMQQHADGYFYGKVINNPKKSKNGFLVFKNLVWEGKSKTFQGIVNAPEIGEEIKVTLSLVNKDKFQFKVKKFFISKTVQFVRIK